jgi:tetratricopeptide (TPR) repeat protein
MISKRLVKGESVHIIPFHTADEDISQDAQYYLGRMHWIDAMTPPMYKRIDELVDYINRALGRRSTVSHASKETTKAYRLVAKIPQARDVFHGREELIARIGDVFDSGKNAVFLEGIGGIGKSELAKQYALQNKDRYHTILFVTYSSTLEKLFCDKSSIVIDELEPTENETEEAFFLRKMAVFRSIADKGVLLIIDNFDTNEDPRLKDVLEGDYRVIFTTRNAHPGYPTVKVDAMRDSDVLMQIFEENYGSSIDEWDRLAIEEIFSLVDYHTYAIELIAKQMDASFLSAQQMLETLKKGGLLHNVNETVSGRSHYNTAFGHICSLFNIGNLSPVEQRLLSYLSLCGPLGILAVRFKEWAQLESFEAVNILVRKSWIRKEAGGRISLHPLVREVASAILKPTAESCFSFLDQAARFCHGSWLRPYPENVVIADTVISILETLSPDPQKWLQFACFTGFLWQVGKFEESITHGHRLMEAVLECYGEASMISGFIAKALGGYYFNSRRLEKSIPWYRKGLEYMLASGEPETEDLAMSYEKVARCLSWKYEQDFKQSEALFLKALEIRQRILAKIQNGRRSEFLSSCYSPYGAPDADQLPMAYARIGETYMELARMYQFSGDYEKALIYSARFGELVDTYTPENISSRAYALYDQGISLYHIGMTARKSGADEDAMHDFVEAEKYLRRALEINLKMRGGLAIDTLDNREYLADVLVAMGSHSAAANEYMAALSMAESLLGSRHHRAEQIKRKMSFGAAM